MELVCSSFLHKSFKKSLFGGCRWSEAFSFINPLRKARQSFHRINCSAWNTRTLILHITRTLPRPIQAVAIHWGPDPTLSRFVTSTVSLENIAILMQNSQTCVLICFSIVVWQKTSKQRWFQWDRRNRYVFKAFSMIFNLLGAGPQTSQISSKSLKAKQTPLVWSKSAKSTVFQNFDKKTLK